MAISKRGSTKATQRASARRTPGRSSRKAAAAPRLTEAQKRELQGLDAAYDEPITHSVADIVQEARELEAITGKHGEALIKGSKLTRRELSELSKRRELLELSESAWASARLSALPEGHHPTFLDGEGLKKQIIRALRYFLAEEKPVQDRVDAIVPGTGVADLVDDLKKLADLVDENAKALTKADLPRKAAAAARELAQQIGDGAAEQVADTAASDESQAVQSLRNRAYWWLREQIDGIRAAGRYVFHDEPRKLALFRGSSTRARQRSKPRPATPAPAPASPA